ncbi:hypothetical protein GCM10022278_03580 [Allohahella marinimesophila]|uniref:Uncharacterized protein n=1 Tax=Allohahella marinimesophila TaxID=1054972 RepID=A0ABP7NI24_9GAMM
MTGATESLVQGSIIIFTVHNGGSKTGTGVAPTIDIRLEQRSGRHDITKGQALMLDRISHCLTVQLTIQLVIKQKSSQLFTNAEMYGSPRSRAPAIPGFTGKTAVNPFLFQER